ncbi:MAG TPA: hypothetical protein VH813_00460 [Candidatus Limnocylindrales bacterium]
MAAPALLVRAEPGFTLPAFERLAPPPAPELLAARIEAHSAPGDIVLDLHGRGGWVARSAVDHQRRALTLESNPLTRLLAELVLRPPDLRHLDAAFSALGSSPRGDTSLRLAIGDLFATRCPTCGRMLALDELIWEQAADGPAHPVRRLFRCVVCRDQQGGGEARHADPDEADILRAAEDPARDAVRRSLRDRFPIPEGGESLPDQLLGLHTSRQLLGLSLILDRIESDLRAAPLEAALRLGFLHAVLPASRLNPYPGRVGGLRISGGRIKPPTAGQWRERNPWLAFEDGFRLVRAFVQRLEGGAQGALQARLGDDLRALGEGAATAVARVGGPTALRALAGESREASRSGLRPRVRLVLGQPPLRPSQERLSFAYLATAWTLGRDAAAGLPVDALVGPAIRAPWGWQATALRRSLEAVEPLIARDGRVVLLLESGGAEALAAAALGGSAAGFRVVAARLAEAEEEWGGLVELLPPGAVGPHGPRTRAGSVLPSLPGDAGDPQIVPGPGLFAPAERIDSRPFSEGDAARSVTETAVQILRARGEPARTDRLVGEIVVGLDRAGHLRRLVAGEGSRHDQDEPGDEVDDAPTDADRLTDADADADRPDAGGFGAASSGARRRGTHPRTGAWTSSSPARWSEGGRVGAAGGVRGRQPRVPVPDPVERLVALVRDELSRPGNGRLTEIEPERWWLADRQDADQAANPLADRVEWAVYSLLSTAGPLAEAAFFERIAGLFSGHDLPDEAIVRACLQSYRSLASTPDGLVTSEDLLRRSADHAELVALLAEGGHRAGFNVWIGRREQSRTVRGRRLSEYLDERERNAYLPLIARAPSEDLQALSCIWYVRGRATILWELKWTAMLGEPLLRRGSRIPNDDQLVRFLAFAPERTELIRHKLERSPLLRAALEDGNWHLLKWNHLSSWLAADRPDLSELESLLGLDPVAERSGEQIPLF